MSNPQADFLFLVYLPLFFGFCYSEVFSLVDFLFGVDVSFDLGLPRFWGSYVSCILLVLD